MTFNKPAALTGLVAFALAACAAPPPPEEAEEMTALAPINIEVDGALFAVKRTVTTTDDLSTESWSIVKDGIAITCPQPTEASCAAAVRDFSS